MNNGDKPAAPIDFKYSVAHGSLKKVHEMHSGLTKREAFAMAAMQGFLAGDGFEFLAKSEETIAMWSVSMADALLAALEEGE
jgi:hypothetical protein